MVRDIVVVVERDVPAASMDADMDGCRELVVPVRLECQNPDREFLGAEVELMASDLARSGVRDRHELEHFRSEPHRLLAVALVNHRASAQLGEIPAVGLFPQHRAVAQQNAGHFGQVGREVGFELAVLLVYRGILPGVLQRLPRKAAEILVFAHFGIVDVPLATDPLQQGLFLRRSGVTTKTIADLHEVSVAHFFRESRAKPSA